MGSDTSLMQSNVQGNCDYEVQRRHNSKGSSRGACQRCEWESKTLSGGVGYALGFEKEKRALLSFFQSNDYNLCLHLNIITINRLEYIITNVPFSQSFEVLPLRRLQRDASTTLHVM